jgi:hypothetical protein
MPLKRRHSLHTLDAAPAPLPVMDVDEKERRRRAMMGGGGGGMSATVSTMQTSGGSTKSINGETDTMQVRARCGWPLLAARPSPQCICAVCESAALPEP